MLLIILTLAIVAIVTTICTALLFFRRGWSKKLVGTIGFIVLLLCSIFGSTIIVPPIIIPTGAAPETWYFTSTTHTVNGWTNECNLSTTNTASPQSRDSGIVLDPDNNVVVYVAVEVYVVFADEAKKRLTDGNHDDIQCSTTSVTLYEGTDTWAYGSSISLNTTDAIGYKVYGKAGAGSWSLLERFITVQLGATSLNSTTWTFYINMRKVRSQNPKTQFWETKAWFHFGDSTWNTRSANIEVNYYQDVTFSNNGHNSTLAHEPTEFYVKATGGSGNVSGYIFETNVTSILRNDTWVSSGDVVEAWLNVTKLMHYAEGVFVTYRWFVNDTNNAWVTSNTYDLTTTEETVIFTKVVDVFDSTFDQWDKTGSSPYLDGLDGTSYISKAYSGIQSCGYFTFEDISYGGSLKSYNLTIRLKCNTTGYMAFKLTMPTSDGTVTKNVYATTANVWENKTYSWTLSSTDLLWSPYRHNTLTLKFETQAGSTYTYIDYVQVKLEFWSNDHMLSWLFDKMIQRQVNGSFPLTKEYDEYNEEFTNESYQQNLWGANMYKLMNNNTAFLEPAYEYANWLDSQPISRLWQTYNYDTESWDDSQVQNAIGAAQQLLALSILTNVNSSYSTLLETALENYTAIFVDSTTYIVRDVKIDGTSPATTITTDTHAWGTVAVLYAAVVLDNETWKDYACELAVSWTLSPLNIPYHQIYTATGNPYSYYCKEDQGFGHLALSMLMTYAYTANATIYTTTQNMIEQCAASFWLPSKNRFRYMINATDGSNWSDLTVHGFGWLEEALLQGYLLYGNTIWLERIRSDYNNLVFQGKILQNDMIVHGINTDDEFTGDEESSDYWNVMAKRMGQLYYSLNVTGYYQNTTFLIEGYSKLYGATGWGHYGTWGWDSVIFTENMSSYTTSNTMTLSLISKNMQRKNVTINTFTDLYTEFGNPFTGEEKGVTPPTTLTADTWTEISPWIEDVGHTLGEINASIWSDGIECFGIVFINATGNYPFYYQYVFHENMTVTSTTEVIFTINEPSSVTWSWKTQYYLRVETVPPRLIAISGSG